MSPSFNNKFIFAWRVMTSHLIAYSLAGLFAVVVMNYEQLYSIPPLSHFMRSLNSPQVAVGPALQIIRGLGMAFILWFFRKTLLESKYGFLKIILLIFGLSYLFTIGPSPGSFEASIYTTFPLAFYYLWIPETAIYVGIFSLYLFFWYTYEKKIFNLISIIFIIMLIIVTILGLLQSFGIIG
jgi:hypothetical protein